MMSDFSISNQELDLAMQLACSPHVFDVRKRPAFDAAPDTLPGATWQQHNEVDIWSKDLPPGARIIVYCVHGHEVSQNACQVLRELGFDAVFLDGGYENWAQAGLPLASRAK